MTYLPHEGDGVTPRPDGIPEAVRPILGRWPLMGRDGARVAWRVVMTRAAWMQVPEESRPAAHLDQAGELVTFDIPDSGPLPPQPWPDLRQFSFLGAIHGDPAVMLFVTAEEWTRIPADRKPPAFVERTGRWYAVFDIQASPAAPVGG